MTTSQLDITKESQEVSPFQAGDHKASTNLTLLHVNNIGADQSANSHSLISDFIIQNSPLSFTQLCITQYYHLSRLDGLVPVFSPINYCNSTMIISTTAKSIKLITRYKKLVPLINFSVFTTPYSIPFHKKKTVINLPFYLNVSPINPPF